MIMSLAIIYWSIDNFSWFESRIATGLISTYGLRTGLEEITKTFEQSTCQARRLLSKGWTWKRIFFFLKYKAYLLKVHWFKNVNYSGTLGQPSLLYNTDPMICYSWESSRFLSRKSTEERSEHKIWVAVWERSPSKIEISKTSDWRTAGDQLYVSILRKCLSYKDSVKENDKRMGRDELYVSF